MSMKCASRVLLVRPDGFHANPDTIADNRFQEVGTSDAIRTNAIQEFEALSAALQEAGIEVHCYGSSEDLPDAVFPNNWFSTHDQAYYLYAMYAPSRRRERQASVIEFLDQHYRLREDFSRYEAEGLFLEGTGSMVLDREHHIAYACASKRTSLQLFKNWCQQAGYKGHLFSAYDEAGFPVYHTNVMLALTPTFALIADSMITDEAEREAVCSSLHVSGRQLIHLTEDQVRSFCGNVLALQNQSNDYILVMSDAALHGFTETQRHDLAEHTRLLHVPLNTIETYGGGSARCMIAELF